MLLTIKFATKVQQKFQITRDFAIIFFIRDSFTILTHCSYDSPMSVIFIGACMPICLIAIGVLQGQ